MQRQKGLQPQDFRSMPNSWPDFAARMDTIVRLVVDENWEQVERTEIEARLRRLDEVYTALRRFDPDNPKAGDVRDFLSSVWKRLKALKVKPEFRSKNTDYLKVRSQLLADWKTLKTEISIE